MTQQSYALWRSLTSTMTEQLAYNVLKKTVLVVTHILSTTGGVFMVGRSVTIPVQRHMCATNEL